MAGLIQQQMTEGAPAMAGDPMQQLPQDPQMMPGAMQDQGEQGAQDEGAEPDENNPAFKQAVNLAMEAMYDKGAAKDIAQQLKSAQSPVDGAADIAYEVVSVVDERTDGAVPDELLMLLAMKILSEVVEIADAAGLMMSPPDVAGAFQQMLLRFLGEQGMDTTQLKQEMDKIDPSVFENAAANDEVMG
jgi:hypothetical protein